MAVASSHDGNGRYVVRWSSDMSKSSGTGPQKSFGSSQSPKPNVISSKNAGTGPVKSLLRMSIYHRFSRFSISEGIGETRLLSRRAINSSKLALPSSAGIVPLNLLEFR